MSIYLGNKKIAGLYRGEDVEHATEAHAGIIEIADATEVATGTNDTKAVTSKKLKDNYDSKINEIIASNIEEVTDNTKMIYDKSKSQSVEIYTKDEIDDLKQDKLPSGTDGQVLGLENGVPTWVDVQGATNDYRLLVDWTAEEEKTAIQFAQGDNGENFNDYKELYILGFNKKLETPTSSSPYIKIVFGDISINQLWISLGTFILQTLKSTEYPIYSINKFEKTSFGIIQTMGRVSVNKGSMLQAINGIYQDTNVQIMSAFKSDGTIATANSDNNDLGTISVSASKNWDKITIGSYQKCLSVGSQIKIYGRK